MSIFLPPPFGHTVALMKVARYVIIILFKYLKGKFIIK